MTRSASCSVRSPLLSRRMPPPACRAAGLFLLAALLPAVVATAQPFSFGTEEPERAVSVGLTFVDFVYNGDDAPEVRFDYTHPAYTLVFTRPNLYASVAYGRGDAVTPPGAPFVADDVRLLDALFTSWGTFAPFERLATGPVQLYVPVALHFSYRRVRERNIGEDVTNSLDMSVLGLGAGVGFRGRAGSALVTLRATPGLGFATRSFDNAPGWSRWLDGTAQIHLLQLADRFGIAAGYTFRWQVWDLRDVDFNVPAEVAPEGALFDYRSIDHGVRLGVTF